MSEHLMHLGVEDLRVAVTHTIRHAIARHPRSQQVEFGPSEVGQECRRRVAYKMLRVPPVSDGGDAWRPTVGTAVHAWLADALTLANKELGYRRWLIERRVTVAPGLSGNADAFDLDAGRVVDWKVVGTTALADAKRKGPSQQYRVQLHLYGLGFRNAGHDVHEVAIVYLPASGALADAVFWAEPWDVDVARAALEAHNALHALTALPMAPAQILAAIPPSPASERMCLYCPWFRYGSDDLGIGCPGISDESTWLVPAPLGEGARA